MVERREGGKVEEDKKEGRRKHERREERGNTNKVRKVEVNGMKEGRQRRRIKQYENM